MKDPDNWQQQSSTYLFESQWYNLRQDQVLLPSGQSITYTMVEHPGYVMVVPLLSIAGSEDKVILTEVYRYTLQQNVLECPAGGMDGQPSLEAAQRELREETGFTSSHWISLGRYFGSTGISDETFELFLATDLVNLGETDHECTEQIELHSMSFTKAVKMALNGEIKDAPSALALIRADQFLRNG